VTEKLNSVPCTNESDTASAVTEISSASPRTAAKGARKLR
jgi:hypothetical protein